MEDLYPIAMVFRTQGALLLSTSIWNIKKEEMNSAWENSRVAFKDGLDRILPGYSGGEE